MTAPEQLKQVAETTSSGVAIGTLGAWVLGSLPHIAAILSIVWLSVQIYTHGKREGWWK